MSKVPTKSEKLKYTKAAEEKRKIENDKVQEERSKKLREWENPYPIAFFIIFFQDNLRAKISYFTEINKF